MAGRTVPVARELVRVKGGHGRVLGLAAGSGYLKY